MMSTEPILKVYNLSKKFPGVQALKDVDFELWPGEIHCLVGANGAGKSTFVKILSGVYHADAGEIYYKGQKVQILSPRKARNLGIATVFQELDIVPYLTIAENIFLGNYPLKTLFRMVDYEMIYSRARELLEYLGEKNIDPTLLATEVSAAVRQMVVITRALAVRANIIFR